MTDGTSLIRSIRGRHITMRNGDQVVAFTREELDQRDRDVALLTLAESSDKLMRFYNTIVDTWLEDEARTPIDAMDVAQRTYYLRALRASIRQTCPGDSRELTFKEYRS